MAVAAQFKCFSAGLLVAEAKARGQQAAREAQNVTVATPLGDDVRGSAGIRLRADATWAEVDGASFDVVLLPGGDPYDLIEDPDVHRLVARVLSGAVDAERIVGAICAGPAVLGKVGLLKARRFTHGFGEMHREFLAPLWEGATFTDAELERDGMLVTAKASAHVDFAVEIATMAGLFDSTAAAERTREFYKGLRAEDS